jgi:AcrR family transcriptional regulator
VGKRRTTLTPADYVETAVDFVSKNGIAAMTMRALGDQMGVDATALYRHFPNKDSLISAMVDWFMGQAVERAELPSKSHRDRVRTVAVAMRETFRCWPQIGLELFESEGGAGANAVAYTRLAVDALRELGVTGRDLAVNYQMIETFVMGSCVHDFAGAPHNMAVRRLRYRLFDIPEFDAESRDEASVLALADEAFNTALERLLDICEQSVSR